MTLEERLEDARRRRAVVLAARTATRGVPAADAVVTVLTAQTPSDDLPPLVLKEERRLTVIDSPLVPALRQRRLAVVLRDLLASLWSWLSTLSVGRRRRMRRGGLPGVRAFAYGALVLCCVGVAALIVRDSAPPQTVTSLSVPGLGAPVLAITPISAVPSPPARSGTGRVVEAVRPSALSSDLVPNLAADPPPPPAPIPEEVANTAEATPAATPSGPADALIRVFVPSRVAGSPQVSAMVAGMEGVDWRIERVGEVPFAVSATHVRYYHPDDRDAAERLALDTGGEARDFTGSATRPDEGRLELYVAGQGAASRQPATRIEAELIRLIDEIFN